MAPPTPTIANMAIDPKTGVLRTTNSTTRCSPTCLVTAKNCFNRLTVGTSCGHVFHRICLVAHLACAETCPLCHERMSTGVKSATQTIHGTAVLLYGVSKQIGKAVKELEKPVLGKGVGGVVLKSKVTTGTQKPKGKGVPKRKDDAKKGVVKAVKVVKSEKKMKGVKKEDGRVEH
jgi:hypothetical protein